MKTSSPTLLTSAFSLVEVTLALGILAFCLVSIFALIPVGLGSQKNALDESRACVALNMVASAARSATMQSRDAAGLANYSLPAYLSDTSNGKAFQVGGAVETYTFFLADDGSIRQTSDNKPARQTLFVQITPPTNAATPVQIYAAVAWPWKPTDAASMGVSELTNRQGFVEALISYVPEN